MTGCVLRSPRRRRPRPVVDRLAAPGLHLIAEVKRRSPSAGDIAAADDAVARARAYAAGGASVISVLCEPHWFGGSVDDLRAVRAAVAVPVLAKDFVVDPRQLDLLRAAGADLVLLLAVLHPPARLAKLAAQARDLGLEPLVEAHDAREIEAALATDARLVGINNRDLRTLEVDPEQAVRLRELIPGDRLAIAESGVRDASTVARWRATGFDAALVGEALMRSGDPSAAARAFVAAGRDPRDITADARAPFVKICGVTDEAGILAAVRAGADAIGLNFAPGTPRELSIEEGTALARLARSSASAGSAAPRIVLVTADLPADDLRRIVAAVDPDAIQLSGDEPASVVAGLGRSAWKALKVRPDDDPDAVVGRARAYLDAGAERILLDTAGGRYPGGTGVRVEAGIAAAVARQVPVTLAGGLDPANVAGALLAIPATGVDVASGTDAPRVTGERPRKDPFRVALFAKRARDARRHRPNVAFGPAPVHPGLLDVDGAGRWGMERDFGGRYVPETLVAALEQLEAAYDAVRHDPRFWAELDDLLARYAGRPTALYRADRLAEAAADEARRLADAVAKGTRRRPSVAIPRLPAVPQARGPRPHGCPQDQQRARPGAADATARQDAGDRGDRRRPARRGHGDRLRAARPARASCSWARRTSSARPRTCSGCGPWAPRSARSRPARPPSRTPSTRRCATGSRTSSRRTTCSGRRWAPTRTRRSCATCSGGSATRPRPSCSRSRDACPTSPSPASAAAPTPSASCRGSSASRRCASRWPRRRATGSRRAGTRRRSPVGTPGILHGSRSLMLQDRDGQIVEAHSASAGLDYPGVGPQLAALAEAGRLEVATATDREAVAAMRAVTRTEGILPALETAHAVAALPKLLAGVEGSGAAIPDDAIVLLGFSGRGDKDLAALERFADVEPWASAR